MPGYDPLQAPPRAKPGPEPTPAPRGTAGVPIPGTPGTNSATQAAIDRAVGGLRRPLPGPGESE